MIELWSRNKKTKKATHWDDFGSKEEAQEFIDKLSKKDKENEAFDFINSPTWD